MARGLSAIASGSRRTSAVTPVSRSSPCRNSHERSSAGGSGFSEIGDFGSVLIHCKAPPLFRKSLDRKEWDWTMPVQFHVNMSRTA